MELLGLAAMQLVVGEGRLLVVDEGQRPAAVGLGLPFVWQPLLAAASEEPPVAGATVRLAAVSEALLAVAVDATARPMRKFRKSQVSKVM